MAEINSTLVRTSRYVSGGSTEVNTKALEWWDRAYFTSNFDDSTYVVEKKFEGRLDLISAVHLGESRYWWIIAQYNNILDAYSEVREGAIIYIPTLERVKLILSGKIGGIQSTREVPLSILPIV
jgi:hypothetical protein